MPAKPGQDAFDANAGNHVGLGITDVVGRGRAGQGQVLDVGRRSEGTEACAAASSAATSPADDMEVLIEVTGQAAVHGGRTRAAVERVVTIAAQQCAAADGTLHVTMCLWCDR